MVNNSKNIERDFKTTAMLMEKGGTGGAIFRNFYRDFLKESYEILKIENINKAQKEFIEIAKMWTEVASHFEKTGETENIKHINKASEILIKLSEKEKQAMELLINLDD